MNTYLLTGRLNSTSANCKTSTKKSNIVVRVMIMMMIVIIIIIITIIEHSLNWALNSARNYLVVCYMNFSVVVCNVKCIFFVKLCWVF